MPREDSVFSLINSYLELNFEVIKIADISRYAKSDDMRLINLASIALFSIFKLSTSSGKYFEDVSRGHIVSLLYKLTTSAQDSDDLSLCFDRDRNRRREELPNNKHLNDKYHLRFMSKDVFRFAEHQEKAIFGLV